ncbi:dihydrofolate reductase [Cellulosimicrobium cellulans J34]|nr:dihydrofolate reductase [Cellulosimicrobium cellulans J34]SME88557.1 Dihydrofolate reductase [Cellulosimicrobium cellulans J1]
MRDLTYYVAVSADGFIAGPSGEFDAFLFEGDHMAGVGEKYRGTAPTDLAAAAGLAVDGGPFDTVLMGWNTYAVGLPAQPDPYRHLRQIVFSREHEAPDGAAGVELTDRDPVEVVRELKAEDGAGIWLCGGGALAAVLADEIDRLVLKINPVLFGDGVRLFGDRPYRPAALRPVAVTPYESGVVLAEYARG